jgi:hypothetical protein
MINSPKDVARLEELCEIIRRDFAAIDFPASRVDH